MLAKSAVVAATVSPALATARPAEAVEVPSTPPALTNIGELGAERERVMQESKSKLTLIQELNDELERLMPRERSKGH
jgi:hypothetical protein